MVDEKQELKEFIGLYLGNETRRKRTNKAGQEIMIYGLKFKEKETDMFSKSFTCQSNIKGFETLKGLEWFKIGYVIDKYVSKAGNHVTSHKVLWIGKTGNPSSIQNTSATALKPDLSKFDEFKVKYLAMVKSANMQPNAVHMVGSFIATNEKERVKDLIEKCKEALKDMS